MPQRSASAVNPLRVAWLIGRERPRIEEGAAALPQRCTFPDGI